MARVPTTAGGFVDRRGGAMPALQAPDATAGFREIGQATQRLGGALAQQAEADDAIDAARDEAAARMVDTEYSDWSRERLFTGDDAFYSKEGFAADAARGDLESAIDKQRDDYLARAANPRQRELMTRALERRIAADKEGIGRYSVQQYRVEERRQSEARLGAARNDALTYFEDPVRFADEMLVGESEIRNAGAKAGEGKETTDLRVQEWQSGVYGGVGAKLIQNGRIDDAIAWVDQARDHMLPADEDRLDAALYRPLLERKVDGLADYIMGLQPAPTSAGPTAPSSGGRVTGSMMYNITAVSESGNRERDAKGNLITSPAGAKGKMQVMPGTERDPGFGVKPMQDNSDAERTRVGCDYLDAMLKRYGGDPAKAWGAYNWGPGAVDNAIKKHGDNWLANAPAETRAYVAKNMAALGRPVGASGQPEASARRHDLGDLLAKVDAMNLPFEEEKALKDEIRNRVSTDETLRRRDQEDAADRANEILDQAEASGRPITKESQIPAEVWNAMDPGQRLSVRGVIARNAQPKDRETNPGRYTELSDLYATDPAAFAKIDPSTYRNSLSDSDYKQVLGWRRDVQNGDGKGGEQQVGLGRIKSITAQVRAMAGLTTGGIPTGQSAKKQAMEKRIFDLEQSVVRDVEIWQRANPGKSVPDDVILQSARRQMTETRNKDEARANPNDRRFWFERDRGVGQYTMAIPTADYNRIRNAGRKLLGRDPTPAEISEVWQREGRGGR